MKNLLVAIVSEGLFSLVALVVISVIVWFGGEYLGYATQLRVFVILAVLAVWLVLYVVQRILAVRRAMRIEAMLRNQASASGTNVIPSDTIAAMVQQFRVGVRALRDTRPGRAAVKSMPWFLVMGPPGSGKSTAVRESGLNFPFVGLGHRANPAAGSTRSLDWWYSERAVFLDTSGAYISDRTRHQEWLALARQLSGTGRAAPVDGVVLVVSIASLLAMEDDRINDHVQSLRDRLDELADHLGMVFPVYLMFSQCDRLHGFVDFFSHLPQEERGQVWGCTFDWNQSDPQGLQARVEEEFHRLYQTLDLRRIEALAASSLAASANTNSTTDIAGDQQRNALLFPIQFALMQRRVGHYIAALSRPNPFQESGRLRGFYFTSAAQGGAPMDRVLASIGLSEAALPTVQVAEQRPYFLNGPFSQVIPADHGLARASARAVRRHRVVCTVLAAVVLIAVTVQSLYVYHGFQQTEKVLNGLVAEGKRIATARLGTLESAAAADDLFKQLERYESAEGIPWVLRPFLWSGGNLSQQVRDAYLKRFARPSIASYARNLSAELISMMASHQRTLANCEAIEQRYRVYLMLCGRIPLHSEAVQRVLSSVTSKGGKNQIEATVADRHLQHAMKNFSVKDWAATADAAVIERTNRELRDALWIPLTGIEIANTGTDLFPAVDMAMLLPKRRNDLFSLERPLSGIFTQAAWDGLIAGVIDERATTLTRRLAELRIEMDAQVVTKRLRTQFSEEYRRQWRELISGTRVVMPQALDEVIVRLGELSNVGSLYRELVVAWMRQQSLRTGGPGELVIAATTVSDAEVEKTEAKRIEWLDRALVAVNNLHVALSNYVAACPVGSRFANGVELDKAVAGFSAYALAVDAALAAFPEDETRPAFTAHFRSMVQAARLSFERDLMLEAPATATGLLIAVNPTELAARLQKAPLSEFPARWREVLSATSVPPASDAQAAGTRLINLSSPQSSLLRTLRAAWRGQKLVSLQGAAQVNEDWIERCGKALAGLAAAYTPAIDAEPGPRIARSAGLKHLAEAFASTERDIAAALGDIPDEVFRAAAARLFAQLRDDAQTHLCTLLANDAERFWDEQVRARFTHDVAGRFPFALSTDDVDVKAVAALFAPTSGALWETERILNAAAEIAIAGKPIIRLNDQYRKTLTASKAVRDALFADFSDKAAAQNDVPHLTFTAEVRQRTGVFQALVAIGKETLDLHESPQARRTFGCVLTEPVACRIAIQVADGKWIEAASAPRPWGLLRWVAGSTPSVEASGRMVLSWNLVEAEVPPVESKKTDGSAVAATTAPVVPKTWLIQLVVDDGPAVALFSRRVFDNLSFPATIAVRHQEP